MGGGAKDALAGCRLGLLFRVASSSSVEGVHARQCGVGEDAQGPGVGGRGRRQGRVGEQLRREVMQSAGERDGQRGVATLVNGTSAAKVDELCGGGVGNDNVLELDVEVGDVVGVEVLQGGANVAQATAQGAGGEAGGGGNLVEHVTRGGVVHDESQGEVGGGGVAGLGAEVDRGNVVEAGDVGVAEGEMERNLSANGFSDLGSRDDLDGDVAGDGMGGVGGGARLVDSAGNALTERALDDVAGNGVWK